MGEDQSPGPRQRNWRGDWQGRKPGGRGGKKAWKVLRLLLFLVALGGAAAALPWFIKLFHKPFLVTVVVTEYTDPRLPPYAFGTQDSQELFARFGSGNAKAFDRQSGVVLKAELKNLARLRGKTLVLHLGGFAVARKGAVSLLPADADPDRPEATWLPLSDVLGALRASGAANKLLVLDLARPLADPRLGVLAADVAGPLCEAVKKEAEHQKGLLVLCACGEGETSLVSEPLQRSVFGRYLALGLAGYADGAGPSGGVTNGRVSVRELHAFTAGLVDAWAQANRKARQTPMLFGPDNKFDFDLTTHTTIQPWPAEFEIADPSAEQYPFEEGWKLRDAWWAAGVGAYRSAPWALRVLEASLLRAEQRWRAGVDLKRVQKVLAADRRGCEALADQAARVGPGPGPKVDAKAADALRGVLALRDSLPKAGDEAVKGQAALEKARQDFLKLAGGLPAGAFGDTLFAVAGADSFPSQPKVQLLNELLRSVGPRPAPKGAPLLERLGKLDVDEWPVPAVHQALHLVVAADRVSGCDPRAFPWARPLFESAEARRKEADRLLVNDFKALRSAPARLEEAVQAYSEAHQVADGAAASQQTFDEAMAFLPAYVPYLLAGATTDRPAVGTWKAAAGLCQALYAQLAAPPGPADKAESVRSRFKDVRQAAEELRGKLAELKAPFDERTVEDLVKRAGEESAGPDDHARLNALLTTPFLSAPVRTKVWAAAWKLDCRLQEKHAKAEAPGHGKQESAPEPGNPRPGGEDERAALRAELSVELLRLGGFAGADALGQRLGEAGKAGGPRDALAEDLRGAWADLVPKQLDAETSRAARDRLLRVLPPSDRAKLRNAADADLNPGAAVRQEERAAFARWLREFR